MSTRQVFNLTVADIPEELQGGLDEIREKYPERFDCSVSSTKVVFKKNKTKMMNIVETEDAATTICYNEKIDAFRALGRLLGTPSDDRKTFCEEAKFKTRGIMFDVSRNGVLLPETACDIIGRVALMGINTVMLYMEDVFELKGEPMFGYLRGKYTEDELRYIDEYADLFGIELIPCIQTLGHMYQIFQWPAFTKYSDTHQIFLTDDEDTLEFIEKMIKAASAPFRSRRIHIGMDEAKDIASGRYYDIHGETDRQRLFNRHLSRVCAICAKLGLKPMMWSDMFFKLGSKKKADYDENVEISENVTHDIPTDIQQVYWEYYKLDRDHYCKLIDKHKKLGSLPIFAGGVLTWNRFWATLPFSFNAIDAAMKAAREQELNEVFVTMWADGGMECDIYSSLPGIQYFAEHAYAESVDQEQLRRNFQGSCATSFDAYVKASELDTVPSLDTPDHSYGNISKWLLWQDVFLGIMDPLLENTDLSDHYAELGKALKKTSHDDLLAKRLKFPALIAEALALKAHLGRDILKAYRQGDKEKLRHIVAQTIPELKKRINALWRAHREMWFATYKPFGWEIIERNYGFLTFRLETVSSRLKKYISDELTILPELESERVKLYDIKEGSYPVVRTSRVISPTVIK